MADNTQIIVLPADKAKQEHFEGGQLTWYACDELHNDGGMTIGQCRLKPGHATPFHQHPNCAEVLVVMQGTVEHTVADNKQAVLQAGDTITVPPKVWHLVRNVGQDDALLLVAFSSPCRQTVEADQPSAD